MWKRLVLFGTVLLVCACDTRNERTNTPPPPPPQQVAAPRSPLPPVQRECMTNDDCLAIYELYVMDGSCCHSCNTAAVAKRWLPGAGRACSAMGGAGCPTKKCAALAPVACVERQCTVVEAPAPQ